MHTYQLYQEIIGEWWFSEMAVHEALASPDIASVSQMREWGKCKQ